MFSDNKYNIDKDSEYYKKMHPSETGLKKRGRKMEDEDEYEDV